MASSDGSRGAAHIDLTNFCVNVKSNPRMHQNPPFSGKKIIFFWGGGTAPSQTLPSTVCPPHYEILDPPLMARDVNKVRTQK